jgi:hypothetical protein
MTDTAPPARRRPGRPRVEREAPLYPIGVRLEAADADRLIAFASRRQESVAGTARKLLILALQHAARR